MGQSELSLASEQSAEDDSLNEEQRIPEGAVERVAVRMKSREIGIYLVSPFDAGAFETEDAMERVTLLNRSVHVYRTVQSVCTTAFEPLNARWIIYPYTVDPAIASDVVEALLPTLRDWFAEEEAVASNWLKQAAIEIANETDPRSGTHTRVRWILQNDTEYANLERKKARQWFAERIEMLFSLRVNFELAVDQSAAERSAELRRQLAEVERKEVIDIMEREREAAANAEKSQEKEQENSGDRYYRRKSKADDEPLKPLTIGRTIGDAVTPMKDIADEMRRVIVEGRVFNVDTRTLPSGRTLVQFNITDESNSITAKMFTNNERQIEALRPLEEGIHLRIQGQVQFDTYAKELVFMIQDMMPVDEPVRLDAAEEKRVELHLHTTMSSLDGVTAFKDYVKQAAKWGHKAIAVTDHGVVQSFPDAYEAGQKHGVKILLGVEAYVVDDGSPIVYRGTDLTLNEQTQYVVFDTETTGLNAREDTLIEIAAVRVQGKQIMDTFTTLIDPERDMSTKITELTGISPDMLVGQPKLEPALKSFREFVGEAILVAHNAEFDIGFLGQCAERIGMLPWTQPVIDTLSLARVLYPGEKNYKLKTLTQKFSVELVNHHRALADSEATAKVFVKMLEALNARGMNQLSNLNDLSSDIDVTRVRPFHATLMVQDAVGLRNLYELISLSHTEYLYRTPRIPKSLLTRFRDGLLIGSACQNGEVIQSFLRGKTIEEIEDVCTFYDYIEIQPISHYENLVRDEIVQSLQSIRDIHQQLLAIGDKLGRPVVATGDVHYLNPQDSIYRQIFLQSQSGKEVVQPPLHFATTDEMVREFQYLGAEAAYRVVVTNTQGIADKIEDIKPIPDDLFTPVIEGAEEEMERMSYEKARRIYGEALPAIVEERLKKELNSIISNGFSVIYLIAHKLVVKSLSDGYLVGSRGSVGSSLVATMTDITEVNPLPPHYVCPSCQFSEFIEDGSYGSGFDLPSKDCPQCGTPLNKDGQDIPFETFLGFKGDKVPDIDLNFSGDYQPRAHRYTEELFGKDHVFRAGTISTVAEKTAYGYVRKFAEEKGLILRNAEIDRLVKGCTGIKRTSGQHPGGQMVVPGDKSIYDFSPVQYPADDKNSGTLTTHFDYHSISGRLLKLDILGHDDPTVIRMLQDLTGIDPKSIPLDDEAVLGLFRGTESLGVSTGDIRSATGTYAIPEFGTKFVRQMLEDTRPTTFSELVRISGLSHGTDVWLNNAQELIRNQTATLSEVICARDDIMVYLIYKGLEPSRAFKIMESIRKGKGVTDDDEAYMQENGVPEWYIESGRKIKYMFPKAHAAAYVLMAVRIAWFKVHHPLAFYATYFTVRADDFDVSLMASGRDAIVRKIEEIEEKGNGASPKEKGLLTVLEVALEMVVRGFRFLPVDLYQSHATQFLVNEGQQALLPPFAAIPGVGANAAKSLQQARPDGDDKFLSVEDLQARSRISKTVIEILDGLGCLEGLPETNQLSLF